MFIGGSLALGTAMAHEPRAAGHITTCCWYLSSWSLTVEFCTILQYVAVVVVVVAIVSVYAWNIILQFARFYFLIFVLLTVIMMVTLFYISYIPWTFLSLIFEHTAWILSQTWPPVQPFQINIFQNDVYKPD